MAPANEEELVDLVLGILRGAEHGTVVSVLANGAIETEGPGIHGSGNDRREPRIAMFVARSGLPTRARVAERIRHGLRRVPPA